MWRDLQFYSHITKIKNKANLKVKVDKVSFQKHPEIFLMRQQLPNAKKGVRAIILHYILRSDFFQNFHVRRSKQKT